MTEQAIYNALRGGPQTPKQIAKATKLSDDEVEAGLADFKSRVWLDWDDAGDLDKKVALNAQGRSELAARYPDS